MPFPASDLQKRALASYFGLAVGDALGATTEFMLPKEIRSDYGVHRNIVGGGWLRLKPGQVTDDTGMSIVLGEALLESGGMDLSHVASKFVDWMRSRPVDIGDTVRRGLQRIITTGKLEAEYSDYSAGNGAVMRNLPVILATLSNHPLFCEWSLSQCRLTHRHPDSDVGTLILGDLARRALLEGQRAPLQAVATEWVTCFPHFDYRQNTGESTGYIVHTVKNVLDFFFNTVDFESCLIGIVNRGGDADTNGALAGMLAGAFYGLDSIPGRWLKRLDDKIREVIAKQTESLLEMFPPIFRSRESERDNLLQGVCIRSLMKKFFQGEEPESRQFFQMGL